MIKLPLLKIRHLFIITTSLYLFLSFLLTACSSNQQKPKQTTVLQDTLNNLDLSKKIKANTIINQKNTGNTTKKNSPTSKFIESKPSSLPDFTAYKNVKHKKRVFFNFLKPHIQYENHLIIKQRLFIKEQYLIIQSNDSVKKENLEQLKKYIADYRCLNTNLYQKETYEELLIRVDIIPQELALVQAALESSWASSYFARAANNLYGQWCFKPGCGVIPRARKQGETHEVAKFETIGLSIRSYMLFLNSHPLFSLMRQERAANRNLREQPSAHSMAKGLKAYSARGDAYIQEVQSMIKSNHELLIDTVYSKKPFAISAQEQDSTQFRN